jgi:hypothetical protein
MIDPATSISPTDLRLQSSHSRELREAQAPNLCTFCVAVKVRKPLLPCKGDDEPIHRTQCTGSFDEKKAQARGREAGAKQDGKRRATATMDRLDKVMKAELASIVSRRRLCGLPVECSRWVTLNPHHKKSAFLVFQQRMYLRIMTMKTSKNVTQEPFRTRRRL